MKTTSQLKSTTTALLTTGTILAGTARALETEMVEFESHGETLKGTLFLPASAAESKLAPGVVITGAWTTVKEQMPTNYAMALAERGYAALVFDFRGWGESEGEPRFVEHPGRKTEDIIAAAAFLAQDPRVARIGGLGICASAGYMVAAGIQSPDLEAIALVAPWLHDAAIVDEVYGGAESVASLIQTGREASNGSEEQIIPAAGTAEEGALMTGAPYYVDPERGAIPEYDNQFNLASWEPWLTFNAIQLAERITKPLLLVHSESAAIPQGVRKFAEAAGENVSTLWVEETTQFDFYDDPESVTKAADAVGGLFEETLVETPDQAAIHSLMESVAALADRGEFEALTEAFAPELLVDYTAAFGGEPEWVSRETLMERWAALLPGFDRTRHTLSDLRVQVRSKEATGTASVIADHWLEEAHWRIAGKYHYSFQFDEDRWQVTRLQFLPAEETGSREILGAAMAKASASPHALLQRKANRETVLTFLQSLEEKDMNQFASVWADEAVQEMPYAPENFPKKLNGKAELIAHYADWPKISGKADFTSGLRIQPMADPTRLFVEYEGEVEILPTGRTYRQHYGGLFEFDEFSRITLFREYFNPIPFVWAFELDSTARFPSR